MQRASEMCIRDRLYHKVKPGETLSSIAEKRGVSVEQICRLNGYRKDKKVSVGQIIRYVSVSYTHLA